MTDSSSSPEASAPAASGTDPALSRRGLLSGGAALGLAARLGLAGAAPAALARPASADDIGPEGPRERARHAKAVRDAATLWQSEQPVQPHPDNGDDELYPLDRRGSFTKGLPHDANGVVDAAAYQHLLDAIASGDHDLFESIPMGASVRLVSPQAAYAFTLEGPDSHHLAVPPAPTFASAQTAAEMVEHYWQALTRDVPFAHYATDRLVQQACADLSGLPGYAGPSLGGAVVPELLFRHPSIGAVGPYVSQFLYRKVPYGALEMDQHYRVPVAGDDHATTFAKYLEVQSGFPQPPNTYQAKPRYVSNGRDLGEFVHKDFHYQSFLNAAICLHDLGPEALADSNPVKHSGTQQGYVTFGRAMLNDLVARVALPALKAAWYQKWLVHRRQRPEKYASFVHLHLTGAGTFDVHPDVLSSQAVAEVHARFGSYLLPAAYPECAPLHPAYPSGHATFSGACATVLKALFDESYVLPDPVVASANGKKLEPWLGPPLTIRGEIDKLAWNVAMGRACAGVHWRSDAEAGLALGEEVAKRFLKDCLGTFHEPFEGFHFTAFDGTPVTIA